MVVGDNGNERMRAWVLIQASPEVAEQLYDQLGYVGGDDYVVVRADVVEVTEGGFNIVVPVDAANEEQLLIAVEKIKAIPGVENAIIARVTQHIPIPPHLAHGFITEQEARDGKVSPEFGRLGNSPGGNAWG